MFVSPFKTVLCQRALPSLPNFLLTTSSSHFDQQPDFAQTGSRLSETVDELFKSSLQLVVGSGEGGKKDDWKVGESRNGMTLCFGEEMGRG